MIDEPSKSWLWPIRMVVCPWRVRQQTSKNDPKTAAKSFGIFDSSSTIQLIQLVLCISFQMIPLGILRSHLHLQITHTVVVLRQTSPGQCFKDGNHWKSTVFQTLRG